jgi:glyoxylase-like metal-dependent hydrolase (beta-lactamase superfamily II)
LFRRSDSVLVAGDAVTTMNLDSFWDTMLKRKKVCRPPVPATMNWEQARESVEHLAALRPFVIAAGHGAPVRNASAGLSLLATNFAVPQKAPL